YYSSFFYPHVVRRGGLEPPFIDLSTNMPSAAADSNPLFLVLLPTCRPQRDLNPLFTDLSTNMSSLSELEPTIPRSFYQYAVRRGGLEPTIHRSFYQHVVPIGT